MDIKYSKKSGYISNNTIFRFYFIVPNQFTRVTPGLARSPNVSQNGTSGAVGIGYSTGWLHSCHLTKNKALLDIVFNPSGSEKPCITQRSSKIIVCNHIYTVSREKSDPLDDVR